MEVWGMMLNPPALKDPLGEVHEVSVFIGWDDYGNSILILF